MSDLRGLSFRLDLDFVRGYVGRQPAWGPLGYVTYKRTYARPLWALYPEHFALAALGGLFPISAVTDMRDFEEQGRPETEEYWLTCARVVEGVFSTLKDHCLALHLPWDERKGQEMAQEMFRLMWEFMFLPPGRGLWSMGSPAVELKGGACLNNCAFVSTQHIDTDFAAPFCFLMDMSMLGVGVGGDTRGAGKVRIVAPDVGRGLEAVHTVGDTREGWVLLLKRLLNAYVGVGTVPAGIDFSQVRPKNAPIRTFGGTASGPDALSDLIRDIRILLDTRVGQDITSADIVDIFNLIGRCVVAGNSRRSAEIMFGDPTDEAFLELKDPTKFQKELDSHRWASNNSIFAEVGQSYVKVGRQTAKNGEPGYYWLENAQKYGRMGWGPPDWKDKRVLGGNPCLEQSLESFELCCLVETFPALHRTQKEYLHTLKYAYLYAKTVTLISTHEPRTNAVMLRNRRIGCSMSGIVQAMKKFGRRRFFDICDAAYHYIEELDEEYSGWLCVPVSNKKTSVKPSGTVSLLPGQTPGIHYPHSEYYRRVIRFSKDSWMVGILRDAGYTCIDIDEDREPNTCAVYFPVHVEDFDRGESEVSAWEQLENAAEMQKYWADNQVSVTVKFDPQTEGRDIPRMLELFENRLKGVSMLPNRELMFEHMPYQTITREQYEHDVARLRPYDLSQAGHEVADRFCDGEVCTLPVR